MTRGAVGADMWGQCGCALGWRFRGKKTQRKNKNQPYTGFADLLCICELCNAWGRRSYTHLLSEDTILTMDYRILKT